MMAFPLMAAIPFAASAIGSLLGRGTEGLPDWYIDMLKNEIGRDRVSGFIPAR